MKLLTVLILILSSLFISCTGSGDDDVQSFEKPDVEEPIVGSDHPWFHYLNVEGDDNKVPFQNLTYCELEDLSNDPSVDSFTCSKNACERVNGSWDDQSKSCQCPEGLYFSAYRGGTCSAPISVSTLGESSDDYPTLNIELYRNSLEPAELLSEEISEELKEQIPVATKPLLSVNRIGYGRLSFVMPNADVPEYKWLENVDHEGVHAYGFANVEIRRPGRLYYIESLEEMELWTQSKMAEPSTLNSDDQSSHVRKETANIYKAWLDKVFKKGPGHFTEAFYYTNSGCAGVCRLETDIHTLTELYGKEIRWYSGGQIYFWQIHIKKSFDAKSSEIILNLDPSGNINLIYEIGISIDQDGVPLATYEIMNKNWQPVTETISKPILPYSLDQRTWDFSQSQGLEAASVLICELGFEPLTVDRDRFRVGPHVSNNPSEGGSIWGWFENSDKDGSLFFSGLVEGGYSGYPFGGREVLDHASEVAKVILDESELTTVTSMSVEDCYKRYNKWSETIKASGPLSVINVSYSNILEKRACDENSEISQTIRDSEDDFLWVLTASNSVGKLDSDDNNNFYCPRNLGARPNTIIVSYLNPNNPTQIAKWRGSNFGRNFSDIAADGESLNGNIGTSYAAPRVSAAAAELSLRYPALSISEVRASILLGVNFHEMECRSGGSLNFEKAQRMAEIILDFKDKGRKLEARRLIDTLFTEMSKDNDWEYWQYWREYRKKQKQKEWVKDYLYKQGEI